MELMVKKKHRKRVRIIKFMDRAATLGYAPTINRRRNRQGCRHRENGFEEALRRDAHSRDRNSVAFAAHGRLASPWQKGAHDKPFRVSFSGNVRAKQVKRIRMLRS